jgi:hypothetical protein
MLGARKQEQWKEQQKTKEMIGQNGLSGSVAAEAMSSAIINFTPLSGAHDEGPLCYLLEVCM